MPLSDLGYDNTYSILQEGATLKGFFFNVRIAEVLIV